MHRLRAGRRGVRRRRAAIQPDQRLRARHRTIVRWCACFLPAATTATTWSFRSARPNTTPTRRCATRRGWRSRVDSLLPITPLSIGSPFGLHPSLAGLQTLWADQKLSVVCNVGPLVQPLTRQEYQGGAPRPYQLFSHSDQIAQWQSAIADRVAPDWMGRAHRGSLRPARVRFPDDHRAIGRNLHARPDDARRCRSPRRRRR